MQIYGYMRVYDAKSGAATPRGARLDWLLCVSAFLTLLIWGPAPAERFVDAGDRAHVYALALLFGPTARGLSALVLGGVGVAYAAHLVQGRRRGQPVSLFKLAVAASSFACMAFSLLLARWEPILGLAAVEAFHDVSYTAFAWAYNRRLAARGEGAPALRRLFRPRAGLVGLYALLVLGYGLATTTGQYSSHALVSVILAFGYTSAVMHFYFDGFIWKVSQPKTQRDLDIGAQAPWQAGAAASGLPPRDRRREWRQALYLGMPIALLALLALEGERLEEPARRLLLALEPGSSQQHLRLGDLYRRQQRLGPAADEYAAAAALEPGLARAHHDLGLVRAAQRRDAEAEAAFRAALAVEPAFTASSLRLAEFLLRSDPAAAASVMRTAVAHAPDDARAAELYARSLLAGPLAAATASEALRYARLGLAGPNRGKARPLLTWAEALAASGQRERARAALALAQQARGARHPELAREIARAARRLSP
jgi:hypothetical protein